MRGRVAAGLPLRVSLVGTGLLWSSWLARIETQLRLLFGRGGHPWPEAAAAAIVGAPGA